MSSSGKVSQQEWRWVFAASLLLVAFVSLPVLWVYLITPPGMHFMGLVHVPEDGITYLAKMYQGYGGSWVFRLLYTPESHDGIYSAYLFYIVLGHLARVFHAPLIAVYYAGQLLGSFAMFFAFYRFIADWTEDVAQRRLTWILVLVANHLGWVHLLVNRELFILAGAGAFVWPLQSIYAPHLPFAKAIALGLIHLLLMHGVRGKSWPGLNWQTLALLLAGPVLISLEAHLLLPIGLGYGILCGWLWWQQRRFPVRELAWGVVVLLFAAPLAIYGIRTLSTNALFSTWIAQADFARVDSTRMLIAFGPYAILAIIGWQLYKRNADFRDVFLIGWLASIWLLYYFPISLRMQNRFLTGFIPAISIYAGYGLWLGVAQWAKRWRWVALAGVCLLLVPNTLAVFTLPAAIWAREPNAGFYKFYFISDDEFEALTWIETNTPDEALFLTSQELGLFVPTRGRRVVFGHYLETIDASARSRAVNQFYSGENCTVVEREGVEYIIVGERERAIAQQYDGEICPISGEAIFTSSGGNLTIYDVRQTHR